MGIIPALFLLPSVVDFSVEISGSAGTRNFSLDVAHSGEEKRREAAEAIAEKLISIPAVSAAFDSDTLKIGAIRVTDMTAFPRQFKKRRIKVTP